MRRASILMGSSRYLLYAFFLHEPDNELDARLHSYIRPRNRYTAFDSESEKQEKGIRPIGTDETTNGDMF